MNLRKYIKLHNVSTSVEDFLTSAHVFLQKWFVHCCRTNVIFWRHGANIGQITITKKEDEFFAGTAGKSWCRLCHLLILPCTRMHLDVRSCFTSPIEFTCLGWTFYSVFSNCAWRKILMQVNWLMHSISILAKHTLRRNAGAKHLHSH